MNTKYLNVGALIASAAIFLAAWAGSAVNGSFYASAVGIGGIWYLLPLAGLSGIVLAALALAGKIEIRVPALVIGGIVLVLAWMFAEHAKAALDQFMAMRDDMSKGFNSSFFTGQPQDTSHLAGSSFGPAFYIDIIAALMLVCVGAMSRGTLEDRVAQPAVAP